MYIYKRQFHTDAYFWALMAMAASIPLSRFGMSVMQFTLLGLWMWYGFSFESVFSIFKESGIFKGIIRFASYLGILAYKNFKEKFTLFFKNKAAVVLVSLFVLHLLGLLYTSNFSYAVKDLRTKLPLLALPLIISTMPQITKKRFFWVMGVHVMAVLSGSLISAYYLFQAEFADIRHISVFISPIRFSLNICIAIFTLAYFTASKQNFSLGLRALFILAGLWLMGFLFLMESGIGIIILIVISVSLLLFLIYQYKNLYLKILFLFLALSIPLVTIIYSVKQVQDLSNVEKVDFEQIDKYTATGNKYRHDTVYLGIEDGKYCGLYLCLKELKPAWNKRSKFDFDGKDKKDQFIKLTIIRYMASKGLRKDAEGVMQLNDEDVAAIERGVANVNYLNHPGLRTRISKILIGYHNYKYAHNPNGSSLLQRLEFWKASKGIILKHFIIGVGTGDLNEAFDEYYSRTNSPLHQNNRWRSHNQYLSIFVAFGILGFVWFVFSLFYPPIKERKLTDYFYFVFFLTILLSMFSEDTIETQAGVTLFAFFNSFLLFAHKKQKKIQ
jgi:O-Antigen ligase